MERRVFFFEPIDGLPAARCAFGHTAMRKLDRNVEEKREIRGDALRRDERKIEQHLDVEAAPETLIGDRRIREAIAQHELPGFERRCNHFDHELRPRGIEEKRFCERIDLRVRIDKNRAQRIAEAGPAGLARYEHLVRTAVHLGRERADERRFPRAFDSLERYEHRHKLRREGVLSVACEETQVILRSTFLAGAAAAIVATAAPKPAAAAATPAPTNESPIELQTPAGNLYGTLSVPAGKPAVPLVLIIGDTGAVDRNGNEGRELQTNAYAWLAAVLRDRGVASVRYDKRGVAESAAAGRDESKLRFESLANDAAGWIDAIRKQRRFTKVAIAGHGEGSLVGMLAAQRTPVDTFISLDGNGRPAAQVLRTQISPELASDPNLLKISDNILAMLEKGQTTELVPPNLDPIYRPSVQPFLVSWFRYDPRTEIAKLKTRTVVVQGSYDLQVPLADAKGLAAANPAAKFTLIDGMSHVLKATSSDSQQAQFSTVYVNPSIPIDVGVPTSIIAALSY